MFRRRAGALFTATVTVALVLAAAAGAATFKVKGSADTESASGTCSLTECSLRQAVEAASAAAGANTVLVPEGEYKLTHGPLLVQPQEGSTLTILGSGPRADATLITAEDASQLMRVGQIGGGGTAKLQLVELAEGRTGFRYPEEANGEGGGIYVYGKTSLLVQESEIADNVATSEGGGIYTSGQLTVKDSTIRGNQTEGGNGYGAGIDVATEFGSGATTLEESTITGNHAVAQEGGTSLGGGVYDMAVGLTMDHLTVAGNQAQSGGGIYVQSTVGQDAIFNSIIAESKGGDCAGQATHESAGTIADDKSCALTGQEDNEKPGKVELAGSAGQPELSITGGPTKTVNLTAASEAIGLVLKPRCEGLDQRGFTRPAASCDAGAVQFLKSAVEVSGVAGPGGSVAVVPSKAPSLCTGSSCILEKGTSVTLTATPSAEYRFVEWTGEPCHSVSSPSCTILKAEAAKSTETATFLRRYQVAASVTPSYGTVQIQDTNPASACSGGSCVVDAGDRVELTLHLTPGATLREWASGPCAHTAASPCVIEHAGENVNAVADVELGPPPVPAGTVALYVSGDTGSEANTGLSAGSPLKSISRALGMAAAYFEHAEHGEGAYHVSQIRVADGFYVEHLTVGRIEGLGIYGDLNPATFQPEASPEIPTDIIGEPQGLLIESSSNIVVQQMVIESSRPSAPGGSGYGVRLVKGSTATLSDVEVDAGYGANGATGATGATGAEGGGGHEGEPGSTVEEVVAGFGAGGGGDGGESGLSPNGNRRSGVVEHYLCYPAPAPCSRPANPNFSLPSPGDGGWGGVGFDRSSVQWAGPGPLGLAELGSCNPPGYTYNLPPCEANQANGPAPFGEEWYRGPLFEGESGSAGYRAYHPEPAGGGGGTYGPYVSNWIGESPRSGAPGAGGSAGTSGSAAANEESKAASAGESYLPGAAPAGEPGVPGGGGGGGGGGSGNDNGLANGGGDGGGGGGGGGEGGAGGAGGAGGGGSFGVYLDGSSKLVVDLGSTIHAGGGGNGGNGGSGGSGGSGGAGGKGNTKSSSQVGAGGNGGAGGSGGPGGGGGGGIGGPSYIVYSADSTSVFERSEDTTLIAGAPGSGGVAGGGGSTPAPSGGGGPSSPCVGSCASTASLPVLLPVYATVSGGRVITVLKCHKRCTGTITLTLPAKAAAAGAGARVAGAGAVLGRLNFSLPANRSKTLKVPLNATGRARLKRSKSLRVSMTVSLRLGKAKPKSYTQVLVVSRTKLPTGKLTPKKVP